MTAFGGPVYPPMCDIRSERDSTMFPPADVNPLAAAIALVVFLIAVFPANAYASEHPEKFGRAAIPFWPRLLGQVALIALVLVAGLLG